MKEKGILTMPGPKEGHKVHPEVIETVKNFYEDEINKIYLFFPLKKKNNIFYLFFIV